MPSDHPFDRKRVVIEIEDATNGWVIRAAARHGELATVWVCPTDQNLAEMLTAVLVAKKMVK